MRVNYQQQQPNRLSLMRDGRAMSAHIPPRREVNIHLNISLFSVRFYILLCRFKQI